jgi:hypothetical protein
MKKKGKCYNCLYSGCEPTLWMKHLTLVWPATLTCLNHPDAPGEMKQVLPGETCRNWRPRPEPAARLDVPAPPHEGVRYIALTKRKFALVDAADYEWLKNFRWHAKCARGRYYAATVIDGKSVSMHRLIMNPPPGKVTDHISGNSLDNTRANLRNCTPEQNRHNTRPSGKRSRFIGVYRRGDKWFFKICRQREYFYGGPFDTDVEAAKARDQKARELFGEYAWLNFPEEGPGSDKR